MAARSTSAVGGDLLAEQQPSRVADVHLEPTRQGIVRTMSADRGVGQVDHSPHDRVDGTGIRSIVDAAGHPPELMLERGVDLGEPGLEIRTGRRIEKVVAAKAEQQAGVVGELAREGDGGDGHGSSRGDRVAGFGGCPQGSLLEPLERPQPGGREHSVAAAEAVVERADGGAALGRDGCDAGGAWSISEDQFPGCVEDQVGVVLARRCHRQQYSTISLYGTVALYR